MRKTGLALLVVFVFPLVSVVPVFAGGTGGALSYFPVGKSLEGRQAIVLAATGESMGDRKVSLRVTTDGTASVVMTEVVMNRMGGPGGSSRTSMKNIPGRNFESPIEEVVGELPTIRVTDPKDGAKFVFVFEEGRVKLLGNNSGRKALDVELK